MTENMKRSSVFVLVILLNNLFLWAGIRPTELRCEYLSDPVPVDVPHPRLGWINVADPGERGQFQSAWQIRVATSKPGLEHPDLWNSGKMEDARSFGIAYAGKRLRSRQKCWWQVRVWDKDGKPSEWSSPAFWRMGFLEPSEWKAAWIGAPWQGEECLPKPANSGLALPEKLPPPAPYFRRSFQVEKQLEEAVVYVSGLGYFELYLNGQKVGNDVLVPNQTNYGKRPALPEQYIPLPDEFREYKVMYLAYDVLDMLKEGGNALGMILGNGFYNPAKYWAMGYGSPRMILQMHLRYSDGTEEVLCSDEQWKVSRGPILMDMVYYGEHYDARLEQEGWSRDGFDDAFWTPAVRRKAPEGKLVAHTAEPDRVMESLAPLRIEKFYDGRYHIDFGQEVAGWVRLQGVEGPEGHKVEIRYLSSSYSGDNSYIFSGKGKADYAARFNWFVFREVEVLNWPGTLLPEQIRAEVVHTRIEESAEFSSSNPMLEQINEIWQRSQTDNMHGGIASDCPHRERSPYTGDGQVACVTVMHNFDARNFYYKWIHDMIGAQLVESGYVPNGAPWQPGCGGGVAWGAAICIIPWEYYLHYGDTSLLAEAYGPMKAYIRYMKGWVDDEGIMFSKRKGLDGKVLKWFNLGEWLAPGELPPDEMVHTFYLWRCADFTSKAAAVLGLREEAEQYEALAGRTSRAFHKHFYDDVKGSYGPAGGDVFALMMGVPEERYERVVGALRANLRANGGHLDTGIFGTRFLFEVLTANGMHEEAYEALTKTEEPGYGRWLALGATTSRESWDQGGSHNHPMFGGGLSWMYRQLAGMQIDEALPAYRHIVFKPQPVSGLTQMRYFNKTPYGRAGIEWRDTPEAGEVDIVVPVGARASLYLPGRGLTEVLEGGKEIESGDHIRVWSSDRTGMVLELAQGSYHFTCRPFAEE